MLPKPVPTLKETAAARFAEIDKTPLIDKEKAFLRECLEIYKRHPIKD